MQVTRIQRKDLKVYGRLQIVRYVGAPTRRSISDDGCTVMSTTKSVLYLPADHLNTAIAGGSRGVALERRDFVNRRHLPMNRREPRWPRWTGGPEGTRWPIGPAGPVSP